MTIVALDLSLTRTGYASGDGNTPVRVGVLVPPKDQDRGIPRLTWIRDQALELVAGADLVVLEGYSFGSKGRAVFSIAELGGVVRCALHEAAIPYVDVSPAALKKYATGRGNAPKDEVLAAAIRRLNYGGHDHNEADALWLLVMAQDHYGSHAVVPKSHRVALNSIDWPRQAA